MEIDVGTLELFYFGHVMRIKSDCRAVTRAMRRRDRGERRVTRLYKSTTTTHIGANTYQY